MSDLDAWFVAHILVHEPALTRFLRRTWRRAEEVADLRQEIYARVYEHAREERPRSPKSFLFSAARHLLADKIRRGRIVSIDYTQDLEGLNVLIDEISPEHRLTARQELSRLATAFAALPENCQEVLWLRRVEGLSQREAALRLGMNEGTLESHMVRGLRALLQALNSGEADTVGVNGKAKVNRN